MIRYALFIAAALGTGATAIAAVQPVSLNEQIANTNITVIAKNSAFPVLGPIVVEECAVEDCSDVEL